RLDEPRREKLVPIEGLPPDLVDAPPGCPFQPRCPYAVERCIPENPSLEPVVPGHRIACWVDVTGGREPHAEPVAQGVCVGGEQVPMATSASPITVPTNGTAEGDLLQVQNLKMYFPITQGIILQRQVGWVRAVDDISFGVKRGETLGLVGESGCGKSTTGRAILQLYKPTAGKVELLGKSLTTLGGGELRKLRRELQM